MIVAVVAARLAAGGALPPLTPPAFCVGSSSLRAHCAQIYRRRWPLVTYTESWIPAFEIVRQLTFASAGLPIASTPIRTMAKGSRGLSVSISNWRRSDRRRHPFFLSPAPLAGEGRRGDLRTAYEGTYAPHIWSRRPTDPEGLNLLIDIRLSTKLAKARALALACRPVGNTAHRSTGGNKQSASTASTAPDFSSGANCHSEVIAKPRPAEQGIST
jgi:hypothetical protein